MTFVKSAPSRWRQTGRAVAIASERDNVDNDIPMEEGPDTAGGPDFLERNLRLKRGPLRGFILAILGVAVLVALWALFSYYWTNYLWYEKLGQTDIFWTPFLGRLLVGLFFAVLFFVIFYGSVWTARKLSPKFRPAEGDPNPGPANGY